MDQSKPPEPRRATTGTRAKSMRHKAILAERFRHARHACWLTVPQAAKLLHVSVRTVHNWEAGIVRVPFAAYKLMRILRGVELPNGCGLLSEAWAGWRFHGDKLISPEGREFVGTDSAWWSLLVQRARLFSGAAWEDADRARKVGAGPQGDALNLDLMPQLPASRVRGSRHTRPRVERAGRNTQGGVVAPRKPRIGLALGSGSARGWSHIGVIRALERAGIVPDVVCGTSIGALVGATYAAGKLDWLHDWVSKLSWQGVVAMLDIRMGGGLIEGSRLMQFFRTHFDDQGIEKLPIGFACVATELATGREVWMREGSVIDAVRASIALPGLFTPFPSEGRLLVDGGLVNPVPVSLCRSLGADIVIAVDLNWDLIGRHKRNAITVDAPDPGQAAGIMSTLLGKLRPAERKNGGKDGDADDSPGAPSILDVLSTSLNIMQVRITHSRLAGEPADAMIRPRLSHIAGMDYHRGAEAIAEGERATELAMPMILEQLGGAAISVPARREVSRPGDQGQGQA